jgi:hypothetical protein
LFQLGAMTATDGKAAPATESAQRAPELLAPETDAGPEEKSSKSKSSAELNQRLFAAATAADLDTVLALLAEGADAKYVDDPPGVWGSSNRKSVLHIALRHGASEPIRQMILALVAAGADVNAMRSDFDWRGCGGSESAFNMLLRSPFATDPLVLEAFLAAGANPNESRKDETHSMRTDGTIVSMPLHTAVNRANANVVGVLLRHGAEPNAPYTERMENERGYNQDKSVLPLHLAIDRGALDLVILLLAEGADPNGIAMWLDHVDSGVRGTTDDPRREGFESSVRCVAVRETALQRALRMRQAEIVRALLAAGADQSVARVAGDEEDRAYLLPQLLREKPVVVKRPSGGCLQRLGELSLRTV